MITRKLITELMFHTNLAIKNKSYKNLVIVSGDTNIFVCVLYHFGRSIYSGLKELWIITGKSNIKCAIPEHTIFDKLDKEIVDILGAMHALTYCDTTSKVGERFLDCKQQLKRVRNCFLTLEEVNCWRT